MAYDTADHYVLLFGGYSSAASTTLNDTWTYHNGSWTRLHPNVAPPARMGAMIAYDSIDHYLVLFGGVGIPSTPPFGQHYFQDTWKFKGGNWTHLPTAVHPGKRAYAMMTYDAGDNYTLLFGGFAGAQPMKFKLWYNDTWSFVRGKWTQVSTAKMWNSMSEGALTYDPAASAAVLQGGFQKGPNGNWRGMYDTWTYSAGTWTKLRNASTPAGDFGESLGYVPSKHAVFLFSLNPFGRTYSFSGGKWANVTGITTPPPARTWGAMTYDGGDGYLMVFGGESWGTTGGGSLNDTWGYWNGNWHQI